MKFIKWLLGLFTPKKLPDVVVITPKNPLEEVPTKEEIESFPKKKIRIAIARGHGGNDGGAEGQGTNEVEYNTWVMKELEKSELNVTCHYGSSSVVSMINAISTLPDLIIQIHLNSADSDMANGCEVLVIENDFKSYKFAEEFSANFNSHFNKPIRRASTKGKKILSSSDRGASSLRLSGICPKILVEPFFISNKNDFVPKEKYLEFMIKQLRQWGA